MTRRQLERFKGPNDLIVDSKGNVYFTDQGQTSITEPTGKVYRFCTDGRLDTLVDNGVSPDDLVLSLEERFLYVAKTRASQVWRLPLHDDGTTTKGGVFFQSFDKVGPDGLALDEEGSLFVCRPGLGSIFVVDSDGIRKASITSGTEGVNLTNCFSGGPGGKTLFITDSLEGNVQSVEWHCKGATAPPKLTRT